MARDRARRAPRRWPASPSAACAPAIAASGRSRRRRSPSASASPTSAPAAAVAAAVRRADRGAASDRPLSLDAARARTRRRTRAHARRTRSRQSVPRQRAADRRRLGPAGRASRASRANSRWSAERRSPRRVLAFAAWLEPAMAAKAEEAVQQAAGARRSVFARRRPGSKGRHFEIVGRAIAGNAVHAHSRHFRRPAATGAAARAPRGGDRRAGGPSQAARRCRRIRPGRAIATGAIEWVNPAYARAVEAADASRRGRQASRTVRSARCARGRRGARRSRASGAPGRPRSSPASAGCSRSTRSRPSGLGGHGARPFRDRSACARKWSATSAPIGGMLDQLSTAVAIFDRAKRLTFYNAAYRQIWSLDPAFLDQRPTDGEILDRLRAKRQLPEQADFRSWKAQTLAAYQAIEPIETVWHLPDGRALARRRQPQPAGRRHLSLRRRDAELRARLAGQRADARAGRDARRAEGGRRGVRRGRAAEADQSRLRRAVALRPGARRRAAAYRRDRARLPAAARRSCGLGRAARRRSSACRRQRRAVESAHRAHRRPGARLRRAAAARRRDAAHLLRRDRQRQCRARAHRAQRGAGRAPRSCATISSTTSPTSCARRSPTSSASRNCSPTAAPGRSTPSSSNMPATSRSSSSALLAIINDILDLASIDAGALELRLEEVDVVEAMRAAAEGVQDRLQRIQHRTAHRRHRRRRHDARRRAAGAAGAVQPALQRDRLLGGRPDGDAGGDAPRPTRSCSRSPTAAAASRRRRWSGCSTASRAIPAARAIAAPGSACRSCARSSNCTAGA